LLVSDAARGLSRRPAARRTHQVAPPVSGAIDGPGREVVAEAVRDHREALPLDIEQARGALEPLRAVDDEELARRRPVAHALRPAVRVGPRRRRPGLDRLE